MAEFQRNTKVCIDLLSYSNYKKINADPQGSCVNLNIKGFKKLIGLLNS